MTECLFHLFLWRIDKAIKRHLPKEVEMCGDGWKTENGVLLSIYTPVITVSLASNPRTTNIPLVACYHYPLSHYCSFGAVFALTLFKSMFPSTYIASHWLPFPQAAVASGQARSKWSRQARDLQARFLRSLRASRMPDGAGTLSVYPG